MTDHIQNDKQPKTFKMTDHLLPQSTACNVHVGNHIRMLIPSMELPSKAPERPACLAALLKLYWGPCTSNECASAADSEDSCTTVLLHAMQMQVEQTETIPGSRCQLLQDSSYGCAPSRVLVLKTLRTLHQIVLHTMQAQEGQAGTCRWTTGCCNCAARAAARHPSTGTNWLSARAVTAATIADALVTCTMAQPNISAATAVSSLLNGKDG